MKRVIIELEQNGGGKAGEAGDRGGRTGKEYHHNRLHKLTRELDLGRIVADGRRRIEKKDTISN